MPPKKRSPKTKQRQDKQRKQKQRENLAYRQLEQAVDARRRKNARKNPEVKLNEQMENSKSRQNARNDSTFRSAEQLADTCRRRIIRNNAEVRQMEQSKNTIGRQQARESSSFRSVEQLADTCRRRITRNNAQIRQIEQTRNTLGRQKARKNTSFRSAEQQTDTSRQRIARDDADVRRKEQRRDTISRQRARINSQYRLLEQSADTTRRQRLRSNPAKRLFEQQNDTLRRRTVRKIATVRNTEQTNDTQRRQKARKIPSMQLKEQRANTLRRCIARQNTCYRHAEQQVNTLSKRLSRSATAVSKSLTLIRAGNNTNSTTFTQNRKRICQANHDSTSKRRKYCHTTYNTQTCQITTEDDDNTSLDVENDQLFQSYLDNLARFNAAIRDTPTNVCSCCGGLFYRHSIQRTSMESLLAPKIDKPTLSMEFLNTVLVINKDMLQCCHTCLKHIKNGKVPPLCLSNGHEFPELPEVLQKLSPLEERLVALNLPFMKMYSVGSEGQAKLKGNIINVENNLDVCAKVIPRHFNETSTIQVQLMRRLCYNRPYMYETISPSNVYQASLYLQNTELYRMHNVEVRHDWADAEPHEQIEFIVDQTNNSINNPDSPFQNTDESRSQDSDHHLQQQADVVEAHDHVESETEEEIGSSQVDETLIYNECDYRVQGIRIAPGEGHDPIPMYRDPFCEEKSFPTIYAGRKKQFKPTCRISYAQRVKSECRNRDRRACRPDHVLYMFRRLYNENVRKDVNIHVRKRTRSEKIKACQAKDPAFLKNLIANDEGYAVWSNLRSSPSYWQAKAKKVLAMIRQLGNCSLFITLSAAESKWSELLQLLQQLLKPQRISEDEAMQLSAEDKANLIRSDPVTCMRHFDHRMKQLMKHLLSPENGVFDGEVLTDFFQRVEFQMRGSPHSHGLYWIKNAPAYNEKDPTSAERCVDFIDKLITCKRDTSEELQDVFPYQVHKHSDSCKKGLKNKKQGCRFGYPKLPMPYTLILNPLPTDFDPEELEQAKTNFAQAQKYLVNLGRNPENNILFEDFLLDLQLTFDEYILAARSACKRNEVYLKRQVNEAWVNAYNKKLLMAWRANMDIQFILDSYACAKYCVGYIMKSDGGISKLFNEIKKQSRKLGLSTQEQINKLASALINGTEISSQEGSGYVLGLPNNNSSRDAIFINTGPPDQRIRILKKKEELELLDENSDDVCAAGMIQHYQQRPETLNDICLADFATMYEFKKTSSTRNQSRTNNLMLLDNSGFLVKRHKRKILRFRNFSKTQHPEHWAREQCMLFVPFRDENAELCSVNCVEKLTENLELINENSKLFYANRELDDTTLQQLFQSAELDQTDSDADSDIESDEENEQYHDHEFNSSRPKVEGFMPPKHCSDEEYVTLMQSLNDKQRKFVLNVLHKLKTSDEPFHYFLSGGAGTGKSHAITAIVQSGLRYFAKQRSEHPDQIPIVVSAPTGKAAFNIFGMTLHTTFHFRPNQAPGPMPDLSPGVANTLRTMLSSCKLIIIDEISMVSEKMLYHIDQRLKQIFANNLDFGGKSVIVVGHLRQLRPIRAYHVFHLHDGVENVLWKKFYLYELDKIMRQHEEHAFCKALNNMSEGCMDEEDIALIRTREMNNDIQPPEDAIWLFKSNDDCAEYNKQIHEKLPGEGVLVTAVDRLEGHATSEEVQFELAKAKKYTVSQSDGLPYQTYLKVGAEYFISTNIDVPDGLFNGSTGTLKYIEVNQRNQLKRVWMSFPPSIVGEKQRKQATRRKLYDRADRPHIEKTWVPITWYKRSLSKHSCSTQSIARIVRKQIPLVACNGMTIHKSQGSSIQNVVVSDNGKSRLQREELYVACSRATSLQGLFINGTFTPPKAPKPNDPITIELDRLKKIEFPFALQFLQDKQEELKIYFHNIGSYLAHAKDLASDQCAMAANIIILAEPWLKDCDSVHLNGYNILLRENCTTQNRNSQGMIIFCRDSPGLSLQNVYKNHIEDNHCIIVTMLHDQTLMHACYKSPQYPKTLFYDKLQTLFQEYQGDAFFIGDFNDSISGNLKELFVSQGFNLTTAENVPTTDNNTQIDGCFANTPKATAWIHESYYSVHKPICCVITE